MSTHVFSSEAISHLRKHPCVLRCSAKSITYTYEFKKRALGQYYQGIGSKEIWRRSGFDTSTWKKNYAKDCMHNWKRIVKKKGLSGLMEARGLESAGRSKTKGVSDADKIKRLELTVAYLKAENDFLAKLRAKRAESNSGRNKNTK